MVKKADVIIESARPGVAKKLGVDFNELSKHNPKIIYCSITGYGQNSNKSGTPAHDINLQTEAGIYSLMSKQQNSIFPLPIADMTASQNAYSQIIMSLLDAQKHSVKATFLDVSMGETLTQMVSLWKTTIPSQEEVEKLLSKSNLTSFLPSWNPITYFIKSIASGEPLSKLPHYGLFYCKDNTQICIGIVDEQHFWSELCEHLGGLLKHHKKASLKKRILFAPFYIMLIRKRIKRKNASYWLDVLSKLPISEVN